MYMNHLFIQKLTRLMILLFGASLMTFTGFADVTAAGRSDKALAQVSDAAEDKIETGDLEKFTDELLTRQLDEYHIAGAHISIVQDGIIEVAKGYGYADVAEQIPVTPNETIFRIGSTSKLFTWTAVMQLAEQGKIDLTADVNNYLPDFQIPATYPAPITMLNLLSHTSGFEERSIGIEATSPDEMISLHDYLAHYMPDRVRAPGELATYSNYGTALAGYIVENISGMPFEQYIETYIFEPLSMTHSTFRQPLPPHLIPYLSNSYSYNEIFVPGTFVYPNLQPAATMCSTANDMAHFMIAHLQDGQFEGQQILKPETARQMHTHLFSIDEGMDGFAYGFIEWKYNGQSVLYHNGDIGNWHSALAILPENNLGFFIAYNSNESILAVNEFYAAFMDAFFPAQTTSPPPPALSSSQNGRELAGEYRSTRSIYNHVERLITFPGETNLKVVSNRDGTLSIAGYPYYEIAPLIYKAVDWEDKVIFQRDTNGKITYMQFNSIPIYAYERLAWYETSTFHLLLFSACSVLMLSALLAAVIGIFRRGERESPGSSLPGLARFCAFALSFVFLLVPVAVAIYLESNYKSSFPFYMVVALAIILVSSISVAGPVIFTVLAWKRRFWSRAGRIHYTLVTVALLGMVWLVYYWRLLGFRY